MFPKVLAAACLVAAALFAAPAAAMAEDYPPPLTIEPTLAGTTAAPVCQADVPLITYRVALTDPQNISTSHAATLTLSSGGQSVDIPLGDVASNGVLEGTVYWPGVSADGTGWPGWEWDGDDWVPTEGNFAWTRGNITAVISVNPSIEVPLSYPPPSAACAGPEDPGSDLASTGGGSDLASTGIDPTVYLVGAGALVVIGGAGLLIAKRRRRTES